MFMETSAKAGHNVKSLFKKIAMSLPGMEKDGTATDAANTSTSPRSLLYVDPDLYLCQILTSSQKNPTLCNQKVAIADLLLHFIMRTTVPVAPVYAHRTIITEPHDVSFRSHINYNRISSMSRWVGVSILRLVGPGPVTNIPPGLLLFGDGA